MKTVDEVGRKTTTNHSSSSGDISRSRSKDFLLFEEDYTQIKSSVLEKEDT